MLSCECKIYDIVQNVRIPEDGKANMRAKVDIITDEEVHFTTRKQEKDDKTRVKTERLVEEDLKKLPTDKLRRLTRSFQLNSIT